MLLDIHFKCEFNAIRITHEIQTKLDLSDIYMTLGNNVIKVKLVFNIAWQWFEWGKTL